ncbi:MAG: hypothetical protein ABR981_03175 [Candidatus Micrarchaeaceae archaeon]|jgi:hypothetical protein
MKESVIGSIYPAALIGKTPLIGNIYMPYKLIFTNESVIAFYPDPEKAFKSGFKVFKAYKYRESNWKKMMSEIDANTIVCNGNSGISDDMLQAKYEHGYGSLPYDKIGGVLLRKGINESEFNILFRPSDVVLMRGLEFCTARSALEQVKALLAKTKLSSKIEIEI